MPLLVDEREISVHNVAKQQTKSTSISSTNTNSSKISIVRPLDRTMANSTADPKIFCESQPLAEPIATNDDDIDDIDDDEENPLVIHQDDDDQSSLHAPATELKRKHFARSDSYECTNAKRHISGEKPTI